jgi:hypothetical protein
LAGSPQSKVSSSDEAEVVRAEGLMQAKKYREAEIVLAREARKRTNDFTVQAKLLWAHRALAGEYLIKGDYKATGDEWDSAHAALIKMKAILLNPDITRPANYEFVIRREEGEIVAGRDQLMVATDKQCHSWLLEAEKLRQGAIRIIRRNDRDKVIAGLRLVRKCAEISSWISADMRGNSINTMQRLISLVTADERTAMLGAAGFDSNTGRP